MRSTLIRKDLRATMLPIASALAMLLFFVLPLIGKLAPDTVTLFAFGIFPVVTGIFIASAVVAPDKQQHLSALLALPVSPQRVWRIKFGNGLVLTLLVTLCCYGMFRFACSYYELDPFPRPADFDVVTPQMAQPLTIQLITSIEWTEPKAVALVLYLTITAYAVSFAVAALSPGRTIAVFAGFLLLCLTQAIAIMTLMVAFFLQLPFLAQAEPMRDMYNNIFYGFGITVAAGMLIAGISLSYAAFRLHHRRRGIRWRAYALAYTPILLPMVVAGAWLLLLCAVNLPVLNPPPPGLPAAFLHDTANLDSARELQSLTARFAAEYDTMYDSDFDGNLTDDWDTVYAPALLAVLDTTAAFRDTFFTYAAQHSFTPYFATPAAFARGDGFQPNGIKLIQLWKLENIAVRREARAGAYAAAKQRVLRLCAAAGNATDSTSLFQQLAAMTLTFMTTDAACAIIPLDGTVDMPLLAELDYRYRRLEEKARYALVSAMLAESAYFQGATDAMSSTVLGYPFGNRRVLREYHTDLLRRISAASTQPYYRIANNLPRFTRSTRDYLLYPVSVTFIAVAAPKLNSVLDKMALQIDNLRLARLHLLLARYRHDTGRRATSPAAVCRHYGVEPFIDDLTGQPFPDSIITADGQIDFEAPGNALHAQQRRAATVTVN